MLLRGYVFSRMSPFSLHFRVWRQVYIKKEILYKSFSASVNFFLCAILNMFMQNGNSIMRKQHVWCPFFQSLLFWALGMLVSSPCWRNCHISIHTNQSVTHYECQALNLRGINRSALMWGKTLQGPKGASRNDVPGQGGGGVSPKRTK